VRVLTVVSQFLDLRKELSISSILHSFCVHSEPELKTLSLNHISDVSLCITKRKPFGILAERHKVEVNRGNCPSFEPLLNAFIEILLNNNPELQLAKEHAK